jgi:hypothetical protein
MGRRERGLSDGTDRGPCLRGHCRESPKGPSQHTPDNSEPDRPERMSHRRNVSRYPYCTTIVPDIMVP